MIEDKKIGLKVASKEEAWWMQVRDNCETHIENNRNSIKLQEEILKMAKLKIVIENERDKRRPKK